MNSSDSNTSLSTGQSKPSQSNVLERVADRSATIFFKTWLQFMFRKKVIDYKNPEMISKFTSQMVEYHHWKCKQSNLKKHMIQDKQ